MINAPSDNPADVRAPAVRLPWESLDPDGDAPADGAAVQETAAPPGEPARPRVAVASTTVDESFVIDDTESEADSRVQVDLAPEPAQAPDHDDFDAVGYESPVPAEPLVDDLGPPPRGGGWTVVSLCAGIGLIACCILVPTADANRRLAYEREKLRADLDSIRRQVATNEEFLRRVADDPNLAERLAQRQMKIIREGTRVLEFKKTAPCDPVQAGFGSSSSTPGLSPDEMSPFHLVHVAPPPPMPPYEPAGGVLAGLFYHPRSRLYLIGTGLFLMAVGLVLGFGVKE